MGNSEHKFEMSIRSIWLEGRLASFSYQHSQSSKHMAGLWNNGCLLKTVNYGGERGDRACGPYPVIKLHTKKT